MANLLWTRVTFPVERKIAVEGKLADFFHSQSLKRKDGRPLGAIHCLCSHDLEWLPQFHWAEPLSHYIVAGAWGGHVLPETFWCAWDLGMCAQTLAFFAKVG